MKIGVLLPSLADDFFAVDEQGGYSCNFHLDDILAKVQRLGIAGLQTYNVGSEMDPSVLTEDDIENLKKRFDSLGITITALLAAMDFVGETNSSQKQAPETLEGRVRKFNDIMDLGVKLGSPLVTAESGTLSADDEPEAAWDRFIKAMAAMVAHAEKVDGCVGLELGPCSMIQTPDMMDRVVKEIGSDHFKINLDPANIVMAGFDPVECVHRFADRIIHTHAKDAVKGKLQERPLGHGDVPWPAYLRALKDIGYTGWLTIERETGSDPVGDIGLAKTFLERQLKEID